MRCLVVMRKMLIVAYHLLHTFVGSYGRLWGLTIQTEVCPLISPRLASGVVEGPASPSHTIGCCFIAAKAGDAHRRGGTHDRQSQSTSRSPGHSNADERIALHCGGRWEV